MKKIFFIFLIIALLHHCTECKLDPDFETPEFLSQHESQHFAQDNHLDHEGEWQHGNRKAEFQNGPRDHFNLRPESWNSDYDFKQRSHEKIQKYYNDKTSDNHYKNKEYKNKYPKKQTHLEAHNNEFVNNKDYKPKYYESIHNLRSSSYPNKLDVEGESDFFGSAKDYNKKQKYHNKRQAYPEQNHKKWYPNEKANEISHDKLHADPPDHKELIPMARYVLHNSDWASIATISTVASIEGFPFSNVKSVVDGSIANSTGVPYFYMSPLDFTARDLAKNNRATVLVTLEETRYCETKHYDAEDPRCTRLMLTGKMKKVKEGTPEYEFAKTALFERHPSMADFPADHDWFVAKLKIAQIAMVDWFGGAKYIAVKDYLAYNYTSNDLPKLKKAATNEKVILSKSPV